MTNKTSIVKIFVGESGREWAEVVEHRAADFSLIKPCPYQVKTYGEERWFGDVDVALTWAKTQVMGG